MKLQWLGTMMRAESARRRYPNCMQRVPGGYTSSI
jgi:hypothetical protein